MSFKMNKSFATKLILSIIWVIVLLYLATKLNWNLLIDSIDKINWEIFAFSTVVFIIAIYFDGYAWQYMLQHIWHEKLLTTTTTNIHYAAVGMGLVFPSGGASELGTRVWLMKRQSGVPAEEVLGSMLLFRLFFYCTTFISSFLFIWSLYALHLIDLPLAIFLLIFFYIIEFIGLLFLALVFYRLDLLNKILVYVNRIFPFKFVERFNTYLMEKITGISQKFDDVQDEFRNKKQITIFFTFVVIQYTIRQIAVWSAFYILLPNITLPPIIIVTTLTTFFTSLPLIIPAMEGVRELSNAVILAPYVNSATTPVEVLVLIGIMQGIQIWLVGVLTAIVIMYYWLFKKPFEEKVADVTIPDEPIENSTTIVQPDVE